MKMYLMTPGPTPVAPETQLAMAQPIIHHRSPQFMEILGEVRDGLKYLFQTEQEVLIFTATGTGAMEGAVTNTLSAGSTNFVDPQWLAHPHRFYRLLNRLSDVPIPLDTGDFRLMSRRALDALLAMPEQARFVRGMVAWIGGKQVPLPYDRKARVAGESKYPLSKMVRFAADGILAAGTVQRRIDSAAPLFEFQSGRSHFAAFRLPDGDGTDLLKAIQLRPQKPLVVITTGFGTACVMTTVAG